MAGSRGLRILLTIAGAAIIVAACLVPLALWRRLVMVLPALPLLWLGLRPEASRKESRFFCAECRRFLGTRRQGVDIPCPDCGGSDYFTLEAGEEE